MNEHIMLYYKGDISALTLFCQHQDGHVCFPPLPKLSNAVDEDLLSPQPVNLYPSELVKQITRALNLHDELLVSEPGYCQQVETPQGIVLVYLARFQLLDPPHKLMAERQCSMKSLTGLIGRPPVEMELLRRAYTKVMET